MHIALVKSSRLWNPLVVHVLRQLNQAHTVFPEYPIYSNALQAATACRVCGLKFSVRSCPAMGAARPVLSVQLDLITIVGTDEDCQFIDFCVV
jgi:hypothetical protein